MENAAAIWMGLRYRRTSLVEKTKLKDSTARRKTYAAGLQQFEEQMNAARAVSAATRPINLYYGLVQAGLAMTAAHAEGTWSFDKHGLKVLDMTPAIAQVSLRPAGKGAFQAVADVTGSPALSGTVTLGALWQSIPELCEVPLHASEHPRALDLHVNDQRPHRDELTGSVYVNEDLPEPAKRGAWFAALSGRYPGLSGAELVGRDLEAIRHVHPGRCSVDIRWLAAREAAEWDRFLDARAPMYRYNGYRHLRPALDEANSMPPSDLMSWWLLLYTFSMLSRYQPRKWLEALDVDSSPYAVAIEYAMDIALETIPQLVVGGLDKQPLLVSKPLAL